MSNGNQTMILLAAAEARSKIDTTKPLEEQARAAMEVTKDFWASTDENVRFRGAVAALLLENEGNIDVTERINEEMRGMNALAALFAGVPVDVERALPPEDFKPIGLRALWMEIGHPKATR